MSDASKQILDTKLTPFERLVRIMAILRSPDGCAWDRKQTHQSLLPYLIEETYEVVEAVQAGDYDELRDELGDLLCQVVFHAQLASERDDFSINDAVNAIVEKLVQRHPHVFGEKADLKPQQVRDQWEKIKINNEQKKSALAGLPNSMPALMMAFRMGEKAGGLGFDWDDASEVLDKLEEETREIKQELTADNKDRLAEEIGDLLFATASLARKLEIDPELALKKALHKFKRRFEKLERHVKESGRGFDDYTLAELEDIWQRLKG